LLAGSGLAVAFERHPHEEPVAFGVQPDLAAADLVAALFTVQRTAALDAASIRIRNFPLWGVPIRHNATILTEFPDNEGQGK
jgi:hypothetical protein